METVTESVPLKAKIQPSMYRVFKTTVQRVPVNIKSLSSHAAFLITLDGEKQVIAWIGSDCESGDSDLVKELGVGVMTKDYRVKDTTDVPVILEGSEPVPLLEAVLEIFWSNSNTYFSKLTASERKQKITNNSVSVGLIEKLSSGSEVYDFQETAFAHPDSRGTVPRVTFVPIEMKTIAYVNVGDQWDIWISRGISEEEERNVMIFLENAISSQISLGSTAFKKEVLSQYIQVARQGEERFLFRRPLKIFTDFEPPGKTAPRPEPKARPKVLEAPKKREEAEEKKEDEATPTNGGNKRGNLGKGISFKNDVSFFGFGETSTFDQSLVPADDESNSAPITPEPSADQTPHEYVDFYSVHSHFKHGHMEHLTSGEIELSMNDLELINRRAQTMSYGDGGHDSAAGGEDQFNVGGYGSSYAGIPTVPEEEVVFDTDGGRVTMDMLTLNDKLNMSPADRSALLKESARNPAVLAGYQVEIDEGIFAGIFVITKTKKTLFHKSLYHLAAADGDSFWLRLQRPGKKGQRFRPLRKVLDTV